MDFEIIYKITKYLACGAMMFFILKYIVNDKMPLVDIALVSFITMLVFAVVENGYSLVRGQNNKLNKSEQSEKNNRMCESFCAMKEHMGNIAPVMNTQQNISTSDNENLKSEKKNKHVKISQGENEEHSEKAPSESSTDYDKFQKRFSEIIDERQNQNDDYITNTGKIDRNNDGSYTINYQRRSPDIVASGSRAKNDVIKETDMKYNITSYHTVPPNLNKGSFEYGYSFLPPANWYPTPPFPPVCVAEKQCPVCPVYTTGTNVELKEWDSSRRVTPPDEINVKYIEEKLNSGR